MSTQLENIFETLQRKNPVKEENAFALILFPVFLMLFGGVITNNLEASGINVSPNPIYQNTFPCVLGVGNCTIYAYPANTGNPCANGACTFSQISAFSFLSPNSPFTFLIQGNIIGFITSFSSGASTNSTGSTNILALSICVPVSNGNINSTGSSITEFHCSSTSQIDSRIFISSLQGCRIFNGTHSLACVDVTSSAGNNSIWQVFYTQEVSGGSHLNVTISQTFYGGYTQYPHSIGQTPCANSHINGTLIFCLVSEPNYSANSLSNTFGFLAFLLGIILLIMSLGIYIAGSVFASGFSFGMNSQGTKIAQILGIGLTVWSFSSSEFSAWIFLIPLGVGFIIYSIITILFFIGLYWKLVE